MGSLDDAIREHLELKRSRGASDEEVKRQEEEAFGSGRRPPAEPEQAGDPIPQEELEAAEPQSNGQPSGQLEAEALPPEPPVEAEPALAPEAIDEPELFEPDEVPADESLDPGLTVTDTREPPASPPPEVSEPEPAPGADPLEETPEFLEESEEDRLWFEQRPPKDFDF